MSIRRRASGAGERKTVRAPLQSCLDAEQALQQGREVIGQVFANAAEEVQVEIDRARAIFTRAEDSLTGDSQQVYGAMASCRDASQSAFGKTSASAERGQAATRAVTNAMLEKLNQITEAFANAAKEGAKPESSPQ
jgi:hypothetical protein